MRDVDADVRYQRGQHIVHRDVLRSNTRVLVPSVVIADEPGLIATWVPVGTPLLWLEVGGKSHGAEGVRAQDRGDWVLKPRSWHTSPVIRITQPHLSWSMSVFRDGPGGAISFWYINLEKPLVRTPEGFESSDRFLDIVMEPDRKSWRWKDEDELEEAVRVGLFTPAEAARFRQDGLDAIARITSGEPPFDTSWADWQPDPGWGIPQLPDGVADDE